MKFPGFFLPPTYNTFESSQKASFLHYTLIISAATLLLFGILNLSWNAITLGWLLIGISGFCIPIIILNKSDQYYLAAFLFSTLLFIAIFYNLVDGAALHDPGIAALPVFLILTSVFFRKSTIPFFTLVSILGIIAFFFFWKTDILILSRPPTINRVIIICILQVVTGIFSWMIVSTQSDILGELDLSEKRFRSLFLAAPIGIGVTSLDGRVHLYNESLINMGGYTPDEYKLLNVQDYYANPVDRIEMLNILESAGVVRGYETQFLRKDRSIFTVNMSILPIKYDEDDALFTIIEDISERKKAEQALQESLQLLSTAESVAKMGSWRWDLKTNQVSYSDNALQLYGLSPDEYDGNMESVFRVFHPDDRELVLEEIQSMLAEKEPRLFEYRVVNPDGGYKVIEGTNKMYFDKAGNITDLIGHIQDITERKQTEEKLQESEDKFQKVFMASPFSMIITRIEDGTIFDVNEAFEKKLGYSREEAIGRTVIDLGLAKDPNTLKKIDQIAAMEGSSRDLELRFIHKDGQELISLISTMIIELKGEPYRVSIGKDITDLRESELRYRMLFENASDAIFVLRDNRVIDCNSNIESMFGYTKEEAIGMHLGEISPKLQPDGRESISKAEALVREISSDYPLLYEWVHQRKDGTEFTAEVKLHQIIIQDETLSLAVLRDTTERKLGEEAALEERQRLAHELHDAVSQTLFSASTIAQTLERTWDNNPDLVHQNLGELQILTQGALAEMRNLLLELRPGALEHIPMPDLLRQLVEGFSGRTKTEIELSILEDHPLSNNVRFVFFRLAQEALNNIIKHARANQVQVNYDSQPDQVQLTIEDDGRGFDPSIINPGRHGVEIMKERAGTINATIHIKSQVGDGTKVSIILQPREVPR